ncbi:type I secretion system permease/ATPase [Limnohabitans sp.]|uniref:type I secretion system permease/ATPase n=1 Tax=Limnohabitans sp. TaxID=1907725 RepID=UPI0038B79132
MMNRMQALRESFKALPTALKTALAQTQREFVTVGVFSMVINCLMLMPSLYMLQIYDRVMISQNDITLLASTILLVAVLALVGAVEVMRARLLVRTGIKLDQSLSPSLFSACFAAQQAKAQSNPTQVFTDVTQIRQFLTGNGVFAFFDAPWFFIYLGVLFLLHPMLGWLGLGCAAVLLGLAWLGHRLTAAPSKKALDAGIELNADQLSKFRNAEAIEAMGMLTRLRASWWQRYQDQAHAQAHVDHVSHTLSAVSKFFRYTQQSLSLGVGALLVIRGELSPGAMIVANMLMTRALQPLDLMVSSWRMLMTTQAALQRVVNLFNAHPERKPGHLSQTPFGQIEFKAVSVTVPGRTEPILNQVSLVIPAGRVVCVVGPSASGKSTLARAILGQWPEHNGQILLDSAPIEHWNSQSLGQHVGYLPQDVRLMDGTLAQNIARFAQLDSERVVAAAKTAGIHAMVLSFAKGYDTPAGEAGHLLSAGQRQRLALARALYGNPTLLVLDEPNANLDDPGEQGLLQAVTQLKAEGKTVVLITHRQPILDISDLLLVMQAGGVAHFGPTAEVLAQMRPTSTPTSAA